MAETIEELKRRIEEQAQTIRLLELQAINCRETIREAIALLKEVEWAARTLYDTECCPSCGCEKEDGHSRGCRLAAFLKAH